MTVDNKQERGNMQKEILQALHGELEKLPNGADIGDAGNSIAIAVGKYLKRRKQLNDEELAAFAFGISHGLDIVSENAEWDQMKPTGKEII